MSAGARTFTARYKLRFGHCDPAGIAFFPRLVEMVNWTVEDWFDEALGRSFRSTHIDQKLGTPAVSLAIDFVGPAELGDLLEFRLSVVEVGRSSITLDIRAERDGGAPVLKARHTIVHCDLSSGKPRAVAIDEALRARIEAYRIAPEA